MARKDPVSQLSGHVVICNCNDKIRAIVEDLQAGTAHDVLDVALIVQDNTLWESHMEWHPRCRDDAIFKTIFGCPTDKTVLNQAGISRARAAIILSDPLHGELADAPSTLTAIAIERENPQVHTIIELIHSVNRGHLETTAVNEVICL